MIADVSANVNRGSGKTREKAAVQLSVRRLRCLMVYAHGQFDLLVIRIASLRKAEFPIERERRAVFPVAGQHDPVGIPEGLLRDVFQTALQRGRLLVTEDPEGCALVIIHVGLRKAPDRMRHESLLSLPQLQPECEEKIGFIDLF